MLWSCVPPECWAAPRWPRYSSGLYFLPLKKKKKKKQGARREMLSRVPSRSDAPRFWTSPCKRRPDRGRELREHGRRGGAEARNVTQNGPPGASVFNFTWSLTAMLTSCPHARPLAADLDFQLLLQRDGMKANRRPKEPPNWPRN